MLSAKLVIVSAVLVSLSVELSFGERTIDMLKQEIAEKKHLIRKGRAELDKLSYENGSMSFSLGELLYLMQVPDELEPSKCNISRQKLLDRALATGVASDYLKQLQSWLSTYCVSVSKGSIEKGIARLKAAPKLATKLFGTERTLTSDEREQSDEISSKLNSIDAEEAEELLSSDAVLDPKLVVELIKKVDPKRLNFAVGKIGDLKFISKLNPNECNSDNLWFIFGKALEFDEYKQAPVVFMQNLAAKQLKACNSLGTSLVEKFAEKLPGDGRKLLEELSDEVEPAVQGEATTKRFSRVTDGLKRIAKRKVPSNGNVFELYGSKVAAACEQLVSEFHKHSDLVGAICEGSNSEITNKWIQIRAYCRFVPSKYGKYDQINGEQTIFDSDEDFVLELGKQFGISSSKPNKQLNWSKEKILSKMEKHVRQYLKSTRGGAYMMMLEGVCDESAHYKENILWMAENGYPIEDKNKVVKLQAVDSVCKLILPIGFEEIQKFIEQVSETKRSLCSKVTGCFS